MGFNVKECKEPRQKRANKNLRFFKELLKLRVCCKKHGIRFPDK